MPTSTFHRSERQKQYKIFRNQKTSSHFLEI
jgi:hypothetical protein